MNKQEFTDLLTQAITDYCECIVDNERNDVVQALIEALSTIKFKAYHL